MYLRSKTNKDRVYWDCRLLRNKQCTVRAVTSVPRSVNDDGVVLIKGPDKSPHTHPPSREETKAEELTQTLKRKAEEHPEQAPSQIMRTELAGVSDGVLSQLPEREALSKTMRRVRRRNLPPNPRTLDELRELPAAYQRTLQGERFLLFDSRADDGGEEDDDETVDARDRVIIFATRKNIEILCTSRTWFLDGTFSVSPTIFTQLFTVVGLQKRAGHDSSEGVPLPLVYALLSRKTQDQYEAVLAAVKQAVEEYRLHNCAPRNIMTDFEKGIINACQKIYPQVAVSCCSFHLGQSVYRQVQQRGLQAQYNDENDRSLRDAVHMLLALAFVPVNDVSATFELLRDDAPDALLPVLDYFENTYVNGSPRRGRRAAVPPRYPPPLWNQHEAARNKSHRSNNASEGWHNRFRVVVGKHHPDLYSALTEIQKEQADTEIALAELSLGRRVKQAPRRKWVELNTRIQNISEQYETYKDNNEVLAYLKAIGHNIALI